MPEADGPEPDVEELERQVRALDRRVRRHKLGIERLNPLERPDEHARGFEELVALEVELRDLKARLADAPGPRSPDPDESW